MGLFNRNKERVEAIADIKQQYERAKDLAAESTAQFEQQTGMSAQDMTAQAMAMMQGDGLASMQAYAARSSRLYQAGVETPGVLRAVQFGQASPLLGGTPVQFTVTVQPSGGAPYDVSTDQVVTAEMAQLLVLGSTVTLRVDPANPQSLMIYGAAPSAPTDDRQARLAKLQQLLATGVLTQQEYDAQVQKLG
jgi:hypothetical protein